MKNIIEMGIYTWLGRGMGGTTKFSIPAKSPNFFSFFNTEGANQPKFLSLWLVMLFLLSLNNFTGEKEFPTSFHFNWFLFNPMRSCMFNYHHPYYRWKINFLWCCYANYHLISLAMASHNQLRLQKTKSKKTCTEHYKQWPGFSKVLDGARGSHPAPFRDSF